MSAREVVNLAGRIACVTFLRTFAKDRQNFVSGFRAGKTLAHRAVIQKFCYRSQRAQVRLKLIFRHDKKNNEFHGRVIQRVELDPFAWIFRTQLRLRRADRMNNAVWQFQIRCPVLIVSSRCFSAARIGSRSADLILPRLTSRSISSTIADQRSVAFISGMICSAESKLARDMQMLRAGGQA